MSSNGVACIGAQPSIAFAQWVGKSERRSFGAIVKASLARLKMLAAR
jgi:hypothetical protein